MDISNLLYYFNTWGRVMKTSEIRSFYRYVSEMLKRNRTIIINDDDGMEAIIFYFLTDTPERYINRSMWSTPQDSEVGSTIFIDKMIARRWTKALRTAVQEAIETKYPFIEQAFWLREPKNRNVIIKRRGKHVYSQVA